MHSQAEPEAVLTDNPPIPEVAAPERARKPIYVAAPRDYFLGPVFAATQQSAPRAVTVGNHHYQIGGFHPIHPTRLPPALDVRHARAIFALLSFRDPADDTRLIQFSFNEFCRRYANSRGGRYLRDMKGILGDLLDTYIRMTDRETKIAHDYRFLEHIDIEHRPIRRRDDKRASSLQTELWFHGATLSEAFSRLLTRAVELLHLKLEVFTSIRSPLAQAVYLYIPSRAAHHSERKPFEITLTTLLQQVSHPVPETRKLRKKLFTQNTNSILSQLEGRETLSGIFRVRLAETEDGQDYKLQAWIERTLRIPKQHRVDSKLARAFLNGGRSREDLSRRLTCIQPLDSYEHELLTRGKIELNGNQRFFEMAKALLGHSRFRELLSEAKGDVLERRRPTKTETKRLVYRIMEALRGPSQGCDN